MKRLFNKKQKEEQDSNLCLSSSNTLFPSSASNINNKGNGGVDQ